MQQGTGAGASGASKMRTTYDTTQTISRSLFHTLTAPIPRVWVGRCMFSQRRRAPSRVYGYGIAKKKVGRVPPPYTASLTVPCLLA